MDGAIRRVGVCLRGWEPWVGRGLRWQLSARVVQPTHQVLRTIGGLGLLVDRESFLCGGIISKHVGESLETRLHDGQDEEERWMW